MFHCCHKVLWTESNKATQLTQKGCIEVCIKASHFLELKTHFLEYSRQETTSILILHVNYNAQLNHEIFSYYFD